jgi:hypothetical protein
VESHALRPRLDMPLPTARLGARRGVPSEEDADDANEAALPLPNNARRGRPGKMAAKTEPPAEPQYLPSRSTSPFASVSLPAAAPTKRATKRKATPVAEVEDVPELKKAKGRLRKVAPAGGKDPLPPQLKPKRVARRRSPMPEEEVDEGDEDAPPQEWKATKARKAANPATRRSTRAK